MSTQGRLTKQTKSSQRRSLQQPRNAYLVDLEVTISHTGPRNCRPCMRKSLKQGTWWKQTQVLTTIIIRLKAKTAKFRRESNMAVRNSWHKKIAHLNLERDGQKLWRLVKSLNGENNRSSHIILKENNRVLTMKQAANHLAKQFSQVSDISVCNQRRQVVRQKIRERKRVTQQPTDEIMTCPFVMEELEGALKGMQNGGIPGPDNIPNDMLAHLGTQAKNKILGLFNTSWKTGLIPSIWKKAILIPILKAGKPRNKGNSYRPISLTSCMCKLMEQMVNKRLMWYLERNKILMDEQAGFRQFRSTEDQIAYIAQTIEDGYQRQQHTATVWVDMEKAFDKVWKKKSCSPTDASISVPQYAEVDRKISQPLTFVSQLCLMCGSP